MVQLFCLAALVALLMVAALEDVRERRIANWLTASVAGLYPVYVALSPAAVAWLAALGVAAGVFLVGFVLFARGMLGGGDVKLIAAVSLWAGPEHVLVFALLTSLAGGALALATVGYERWWPVLWWLRASVVACFSRSPRAAPGYDASAATAPAAAGFDAALQTTKAGFEDAPRATPHATPPTTLPYGIAIAAGGLFVAFQLMKP